MTPLRCVTIRLADDESGNRLMCEIAAETLRADAADIVLVHEHGGWWLQFALIDRAVRIVASANDGAGWSNEIRDWHQAIKGRRREHLPAIDRNALVRG